MEKLLPPLVEGTIPAFYSENGMVNITIPFFMNRAVSPAAIKGFVVKVKTAQSSTYIYSAEITSPAYFDIKSNSPYVILRISTFNSSVEREFINRIKVGQFYKFQIAYISTEGEIGYFSTVTVGKYTTKPSNVAISNLNRNVINPRAYQYTGVYSNADVTEKVYSYEFNIYNSKNRRIYSTGDLLHNNENDVEATESHDTFDLTIDLPDDEVYSLEYVVTTINNLVAKSGYYRIAQRETLAPEIDVELVAELHQDDGYIQVNYIGDLEASGSFLLTRACSDTDFSIWSKVSSFRLVSEAPQFLAPFRDFTIEQGKTYQYAIVQYNSHDLYSNKLYSNQVYADFEHAYLYDGKRQLKIKYNPKIASLKTNVLESKVDTIGGQYPFIFRNGAVNYKEFSISGLISLISDENGLFLDKTAQLNLIRETTPSTGDCIASRTDLTSNNFFDERIFKLEAMRWLTNGESKLFRSPGEGNYIVRLMNTSLAPNDTLGRMLHTFTSTAYEVADFNYNNLFDNEFLELKDSEKEKNAVIYWTTVNLNNISRLQSINSQEALTVEFGDMKPGERVTLFFSSGRQTEITIGSTGVYQLDKETSIKAMYLTNYYPRAEGEPAGYCIYSYENVERASDFSTIANITYKDIPATQLIGKVDNSNEDLHFIVGKNQQGNSIINPKMELVKVYYIRARKRDIVPIFKESGNYYQSPFTNDTPLVKPNPAILYHVVPRENLQKRNAQDIKPLQLIDEDFILNTATLGKYEEFLDYNIWTEAGSLGGSTSGKENAPTSYYKDLEYTGIYDKLTPAYDTTFSLFYNNKEHIIDLADTEEFYTDKIDSLDKIRVGSGVIIELGYQVKLIDYVAEETNATLALLKQSYITANNDLAHYLSHGDNVAIKDEYMVKLNKVRKAYNTLCKNVYNDIYAN